MPKLKKQIKKTATKKTVAKKVSGPVMIRAKIEPPITETRVEMGLAEVLMIAVIGLAFSFYLALSAFPANQTVEMAGLSTGTYFVDCAATTNGSGSEASPFNSINYAIQAVDAGSLIKVKPGNCTGDGRINVVTSNLTLEAIGEVITRGFTVFNLATWQPVSGVTIRNFKIANTTGDEISGTGMIVGGNNNTIENNYITQTGRQGIYIYGVDYDASNNIISSNTVEYSGLSYNDMNAIGILAYGAKAQGNYIKNNTVKNNNHVGIAAFLSSNNNISGNNIYGNGSAGIHIGGNSAGNVIEKNVVYNNCMKMDDVYGIDLLQAGNNNIVRYNKVYSQHDTINDSAIGPNPGNPAGSPKYGTGGIRFDGGVPNASVWSATGNRAYYNSVYNERTGMTVLNFNNVEFDNNTIFNSSDTGMYFLAYNDARTNFSGLVVKNNVIHTAPKMINFAVRPQSTWSGYPVFNNNIYYQPAGAKFVWTVADVFTVTEVNFPDWKKLPAIIANNSDANSLTSDPMLQSPTSGNFTLTSGSPAINTGVLVGLTNDFVGTPISGNPDIGAFESIGGSVCVPKTCSQLGKNCGSQSDGCGVTLNCGTCTAAQTCSNGTCQIKTCTDSACCKVKNSRYPYYNSSKKKCCKSSSIFASCIAP